MQGTLFYIALFFLCAIFSIANMGIAHAQMVVRDVPLGQTYKWKKHVKMLEEQKKTNNKSQKSTINSFIVENKTSTRQHTTYKTVAVHKKTKNNTQASKFIITSAYKEKQNTLKDSTKLSISKDWAARISRASRMHNVPAPLIAAVLKVESNFNPNAVSHKGAQGAMQIMPATARFLGLKDSFDVDANIDAGTKYLSQLLQEFPKTELALAAYNAGPGAVHKYGGIPPYKETENYVVKVLRYFVHYGDDFK